MPTTLQTSIEVGGEDFPISVQFDKEALTETQTDDLLNYAVRQSIKHRVRSAVAKAIADKQDWHGPAKAAVEAYDFSPSPRSGRNGAAPTKKPTELQLLIDRVNSGTASLDEVKEYLVHVQANREAAGAKGAAARAAKKNG